MYPTRRATQTHPHQPHTHHQKKQKKKEKRKTAINPNISSKINLGTTTNAFPSSHGPPSIYPLFLGGFSWSNFT